MNSKNKIISQALNLHKLGEIEKASRLYESIIKDGVRDPYIYSNYGVICKQRGNTSQAIYLYRESIKFFPSHANSYGNLGSILHKTGDLEEAEIMTRIAIKLDPNNANYHRNLGSILASLGKFKEAKLSTQESINLDQNSSLSYSNLGRILTELEETEYARKALEKAIKINPNEALAYMNLGLLYESQAKLNSNGIQFKHAIKEFKIAIRLDSNLSTAKSELLRSASRICDWDSIKKYSFFLEDLGINGSSICPLTLMPFEDNPSKHLKRARKFYKDNFLVKESLTSKLFKRNKEINSKIRIGYFSSKIHEHPSTILISRILELHNKDEFEIIAYALRNKREDIYTSRIKKCVSKFIDLSDLSDKEAAEMIRKDKLDIAIDLSGYSAHSRMRIFSYRVSPIQITYLDYLGSTGADCIDYLLADKEVIPNEYKKFYHEKIINLPNSMQCNDDTIKESNKIFRREDAGLPKKGFIFCNFGQSYKITSKEFDIWMELLHEVDNSFLWLFESNYCARDNLLKEAKDRGIGESRIIFAERLSLENHMERQYCADLFLDTFNQNSGVMSFLALKCNLPVLTLSGKSMIARISTSILKAINMEELITTNIKEYKNIAYNLATNPIKYKSLKSKLEKMQRLSPYFNSELFTRNLEKELKKLLHP